MQRWQIVISVDQKANLNYCCSSVTALVLLLCTHLISSQWWILIYMFAVLMLWWVGSPSRGRNDLYGYEPQGVTNMMETVNKLKILLSFSLSSLFLKYADLCSDVRLTTNEIHHQLLYLNQSQLVSALTLSNLSHIMRKPVLPYSNNKDADLRSLISVFVIRCLDSIIHPFYIRNFKPLACLCGCADRFEF